MTSLKPQSNLIKAIYKLFLPIIVLAVLAFLTFSIWLIKSISEPPKAAYKNTPEKFGIVSTRAAQMTNETWVNEDGSISRGWLLKGMEKSPAVIFVHRFGGDRSELLNLGVKLNEASDFTILVIDLRAHGLNPANPISSFGGCEADDVASAAKFLETLKTSANTKLIGDNIGIYGVEMGTLAGINAAAKHSTITSIVLDSIPDNSNFIVSQTIKSKFPFAAGITSIMAIAGLYPYFYDGCYDRASSCEVAKNLPKTDVLLLASNDNAELQKSTIKLHDCFPNKNLVHARTDLTKQVPGIVSATLEQSQVYDTLVIDFFKESLSNPAPKN